MRAIWKSIKNNPVIVVAVLTISAQVVQHAVDSNTWDAKTLSIYAFQLAMAYVARELVVPVQKHEATKELVSKAIVRLEEDRKKRLRGIDRGPKNID
ncbi:hypothetical protein [Streptomyces griseosporeus]|uniref:hypothetical protein n=1 Tax=Streptomyces griseosporeus TaxID=1910 RepID=UPI00167DC8F4|nr:hypothetical protein [Streptomyces griseosporeus]GHF92003.1 hypothetical protein GCM10018783_73520 [Streptomyces griseosporeus]